MSYNELMILAILLGLAFLSTCHPSLFILVGPLMFIRR